MDETHLLVGARYIELNPVRAGLVDRPESYRWSSAKAHMQGRDDGLVKASALLDLVPDWKRFLSDDISDKHLSKLRSHQRTGRPLGDDDFIVKLEALSGRSLRPQKPGPKREVSDS